MQPPLFNIFTSFSLKLLSDPTFFWEMLFMAMGLTATVLLYVLGRVMEVPRWILHPVITFGFIFNPSSILYERWYFYTYPTFFFFTLWIVLFALYLRKKNISGTLAFWVLSVLIYLRSVFQLYLFPIVWVLFPKSFKPSLIPFVLAIALYLKNLFIFGFFGSTSWGGMNLSKGLKATGKIFGFGSGYDPMFFERPFSKVDVYEKYVRWKRFGNPLTDSKTEPFTGRNNYNHSIYIEVSRRLFGESLKIIAHEPYRLFITFAMSFYFFLKPPYSYLVPKGFFGKPPKTLERYLQVFRFLYFFITLSTLLSMIYGVFFWKRLNDVERFVLVNFAYFLIFSFADPGENHRFRFIVEPVWIIFSAKLIEKILLSMLRSLSVQERLNR